MSLMFNRCYKLSLLPNISKGNTNNITDMRSMLVDINHYNHYLMIQNWILIIFKIWVVCLKDVNHYHFYLIFQNRILIMLIIWVYKSYV